MEEIARRLEATRREKGLTLEEIEAATHIRKKYLLALEQGRQSAIPGEVYLKGFLRSYGNFLGLDGEALVEEYKQRYAKPYPSLPKGQDQRRGVASGFGMTHAQAEEPVRPKPEPTQPEPAARQPEPMAGQAEPTARQPEPTARQPEPTARQSEPSVGQSEPMAGQPAPAARQPEPSTPQRPPRLVEPAMRAPRNSPNQGQKGGTGAVRRPAVARKQVPHSRFVFRRIVVSAVLLVPLGLGLRWWLGRPAAQPQTPPPVADNDKPEPEPTPPPKQEPEPRKPEVTMAPPKGELVVFTVSESPINLKFQITGSENRWMEVKVDGAVKFSGKITGPLNFQGGIIDVNAGNMNGVSIEVNGTRFEQPLEGGRWLLQFKSKS